MTTHRPSAKIYQFPQADARVRSRSSSRAAQPSSRALRRRAAAPVKQSSVHGSWYHEAAMREAEQARKR